MLKMTKRLQKKLETVNSEVNREPWVSDIDTFGDRDNWSPTGKDCDSKAMKKRDMLVELGIPIDSLGMATCWTETEEYHAVLIVYTDKGDYVLDNRKDWIKPWEELTSEGYKWDKRFDPIDKVWRSMKEDKG